MYHELIGHEQLESTTPVKINGYHNIITPLFLSAWIRSQSIRTDTPSNAQIQRNTDSSQSIKLISRNTNYLNESTHRLNHYACVLSSPFTCFVLRGYWGWLATDGTQQSNRNNHQNSRRDLVQSYE